MPNGNNSEDFRWVNCCYKIHYVNHWSTSTTVNVKIIKYRADNKISDFPDHATRREREKNVKSDKLVSFSL